MMNDALTDVVLFAAGIAVFGVVILVLDHYSRRKKAKHC